MDFLSPVFPLKMQNLDRGKGQLGDAFLKRFCLIKELQKCPPWKLVEEEGEANIVHPQGAGWVCPMRENCEPLSRAKPAMLLANFALPTLPASPRPLHSPSQPSAAVAAEA